MEDPPGTIARARELLLLSLAGLALAILMTWPLAAGLGHLGRTSSNDADGQLSIWNVSWVARTLVVDPLHVFDANIFYPHKTTLAYSEANLLPGAIGIPVYWASGNPWLTLNVVLLVAFASAFVCAFLLLRYLTDSPGAAAAGAILYAFCPFVMSHLSHIQLLFTGGIPLSLLMLHRLVDAVSFRLKAEATGVDGEAAGTNGAAAGANGEAEPTESKKSADAPSSSSSVASAFRRKIQVRRKILWRGVTLGVVLAAQALSCAYYGIFAGLMVGYGTLVLAGTRRLWKSSSYWIAIATGAATSVLLVLPFFIPYLRVQDETGFRRTMEDAIRNSAEPHYYLASAARAHGWLVDIARYFGPFHENLFPGILAIVLGGAGLVFAAMGAGASATAARGASRDRETALLYGTLIVIAGWASFGPAAGLYRVLFHLPAFSFLRAPSRFGLIVVLGLAVLASLALRGILDRIPARWRALAAAVAVVAAVADVTVIPIKWYRAPDLPSPYAQLAQSPRAPVAEFPFYGERIAFPLHSQYMLFSTSHWMPLVNGYSDVIPADFREAAGVLDGFPSDDAFTVLARHRVRYIAVHWDMFVERKDEIRRRLEPYAGNLRILAEDPRMTLYEVVRYP
jgi:hypothetical protein